MKRIILNIVSKIILMRRDIKTFSYIQKEEQHPQSVKISSTSTPDGKSLNDWMSGGWNSFLHNS